MWLYLHQRGLTRHIKSHQQQQPSSTCDQCGKMFSRQDNLMKHLRHHCDHLLLLPQLPQQQQQQQHKLHHHQSSPSTINTRQWNVERYNIDMQETQHLDHLSPPPPPPPHLLPTMKTVHTKHHAYKFQGCHHDCVPQGG